MQLTSRRKFIGTCGLGLLAFHPVATLLAVEEKVQIQRLNWAGIRFTAGNTELLVDAVLTDIWDGDSPHPFIQPQLSGSRRYALITHIHTDHFDSVGLKAALGERGRVICHEDLAAYVASQGHRIIAAKTYQPIERGPFSILPLPAIDGLGGQQVSWLINAGGKRYLHCGDTIWHGHWRTWGRVYGPFEAVFLPVNGAIQADEPASEIPLSLTPHQAVDAAILLGAKRLVPIHYGYHVEGAYEEHANVIPELKQHASRRGVVVQEVVPGELLSD